MRRAREEEEGCLHGRHNRGDDRGGEEEEIRGQRRKPERRGEGDGDEDRQKTASERRKRRRALEEEDQRAKSGTETIPRRGRHRAKYPTSKYLYFRLLIFFIFPSRGSQS